MTTATVNLDELKSHIGRTQTASDVSRRTASPRRRGR